MTSRIREVLLTDGEQLAMAFCPPLPTQYPRLRAVDPLQSVSRGLERIIRSTACWRGYVATWSLDKGRLFLVRVEGRYQLDGAEPLLAEWFIGVLRVGRTYDRHELAMRSLPGSENRFPGDDDF